MNELNRTARTITTRTATINSERLCCPLVMPAPSHPSRMSRTQLLLLFSQAGEVLGDHILCQKRHAVVDQSSKQINGFTQTGLVSYLRHVPLDELRNLDCG